MRGEQNLRENHRTQQLGKTRNMQDNLGQDKHKFREPKRDVSNHPNVRRTLAPPTQHSHVPLHSQPQFEYFPSSSPLNPMFFQFLPFSIPRPMLPPTPTLINPQHQGTHQENQASAQCFRAMPNFIDMQSSSQHTNPCFLNVQVSSQHADLCSLSCISDAQASSQPAPACFPHVPSCSHENQPNAHVRKTDLHLVQHSNSVNSVVHDFIPSNPLHSTRDPTDVPKFPGRPSNASEKRADVPRIFVSSMTRESASPFYNSAKHAALLASSAESAALFMNFSKHESPFNSSVESARPFSSSLEHAALLASSAESAALFMNFS